MELLFLILLLLAVFCFLATAFGFVGPRGNFLALGLFFWVLVDLIRLITKM